METGARRRYALCFLPPFLLAVSGQNVFLPLMAATGSFANPFLFGVLPCLLAWRHRAAEAGEDDAAFLPGGLFSVSALGSGAATLVLAPVASDAAHFVASAGDVLQNVPVR